MATIAETERFLIDDEGDGWLTIGRKGGDSMSVQANELAKLIEVLQRIHVRGSKPSEFA